MKNFKKVLAVMTAVATICMSATAFAANTGKIDTANIVGEYKGESNTFTITAPTATTGEATILVFKPGSTATVADEDIIYINQATNADFGTMGFKLNDGETEIPAGTYKVRIGWDAGSGFNMEEVDLVVAAEGGAKTLTFKWGDITLNGSIDAEDALAAFYLGAGDAKQYTKGTDTYTVGQTYGNYKWGDITLNGSIDAEDALAAFYLGAGDAKQYTANGATYTVGTEATIEVE